MILSPLLDPLHAHPTHAPAGTQHWGGVGALVSPFLFLSEPPTCSACSRWSIPGDLPSSHEGLHHFPTLGPGPATSAKLGRSTFSSGFHLGQVT